MLTPSHASYLLSQSSSNKPPLIYRDWLALKVSVTSTVKTVWQALHTKII